MNNSFERILESCQYVNKKMWGFLNIVPPAVESSSSATPLVPGKTIAVHEGEHAQGFQSKTD